MSSISWKFQSIIEIPSIENEMTLCFPANEHTESCLEFLRSMSSKVVLKFILGYPSQQNIISSFVFRAFKNILPLMVFKKRRRD